MLIIGSILLVMNRKAKADKEGNTGSTFDWTLLYLVLFIGLTGSGGSFEDSKRRALAYGVYTIHLILILTLFIFAPYSKLAHMFYRTTAMVFAKHTGGN